MYGYFPCTVIMKATTGSIPIGSLFRLLWSSYIYKYQQTAEYMNFVVPYDLFHDHHAMHVVDCSQLFCSAAHAAEMIDKRYLHGIEKVRKQRIIHSLKPAVGSPN